MTRERAAQRGSRRSRGPRDGGLSKSTARALRRIQSRIERYYALESAPDVTDFTLAGCEGEREVLWVRSSGEDIELALRVPGEPARAGLNDVWLQLMEGVSHFVYLAERVRTGLPTTQLELELQAEVDKFVLLALVPESAEPNAALALHQGLFENALFLHPENSEAGERYRLANQLAARLSARLVGRSQHEARALLRRFYRAGQAGKIELARAA